MTAATSKRPAAAETAPDIARILHRFAQPETTRYGTMIRAENTPGLLRAVLREIDETVLPRRIVLENGSGNALTLAVSNRRLLWTSLGEHKPQVAPASPAEVAEQSAAALLDFITGTSGIRIMPPERLDLQDRPDMSCSARSLAEAAGLPDWAGHPGTGGQDILARLKTDAYAWAETAQNGEIAACGGANPAVERLRRYWTALIEGSRRGEKQQQLPARKTRCIIVPLDDTESLLILEPSETSPVLALMHSERAFRIAKSWHDLNP